jgi:hypothetical protein
MTSTDITRDEIERLYNPAEIMTPVHAALEVACSSPDALIRFLSRYANLNAWFGSGVASLSGKIGRSRSVFVDESELIKDLADRSVFVASYFFDAARDEFDDRDTPHRDTHRCLAQACIKGAISYYLRPDDNDLGGLERIDSINQLLTQPIWLEGINHRVATGYGVGTSEHPASMFRSMGYHVGSEILADGEFTAIDAAIRSKLLGLANYLSDLTFLINKQYHSGYAWISLHSSTGAGAAKEVEHFQSATEGVRMALSFVPPEVRDAYRHQVHLGIGSFVRDHQEFFNAVSL